jgi:catechol 2,3-dioxygenase-like lactoylglutathione lyase family enzyme
MGLKFGHTEIFVKEPLKSMDFYINVLGFELVEVQHNKVVWLKHGEHLILLRPGANKLNSSTYQLANIAMVIYTDDLPFTVNDFLKKGVEFIGDDGPNCYTFKDPDGNWIQLVNPADH